MWLLQVSEGLQRPERACRVSLTQKKVLHVCVLTDECRQEEVDFSKQAEEEVK